MNLQLFLIAPQIYQRHLARGNGVCLAPNAFGQNRLKGFSADNSYHGHFAVLDVSLFMWNALWIFVGGGLGSLGRWWLSGRIASSVGETFPWGTLVINITGSFVIGLFATATGPDGRWLASTTFRQFFMLGICGGYTTFSSFSLQTLTLAQDGEWFKAGANCVLSLVLCLVGVWLGHILALEINSLKGH